MIFTHLKKASRPTSGIAMAMILATAGTLTATAIESPASAQRAKEREEQRNKRGKDAQPAQAKYSKEFMAAYQPIETIQKAEGGNVEDARPLVGALVAAIKSPDEMRAGGGVLFNLGNDLGDDELRLQGINFMLGSGLLDDATAGQLHFASYQTYAERGDVAAARAALEKAIGLNYTFNATMTDGSQRTIGATEMQRMIADLYFDAEQNEEGLAYLSGVIDGLKGAGQPVPEGLIRAGLARAYENDMGAASSRFVALLAENYPDSTVWGDAIIITLNSNTFPNPETLDLLRLSRRINVYNDTRVLSEYVEMLDSRRYPGEVIAAIDEGFALGNIDKADPFLIEARRDAATRVDTDRRELPNLAKEARASAATAKTLVVAGDTFLSYDQPAEAEEFYARALGMPGVETPVVLTRLGIAQFDQGKYAEAIETFGKVQGQRAAIANLWAIYGAQKQAAM